MRPTSRIWSCASRAENPRHGYTRIRDVVNGLGHEVGRNTVKRILSDDGIELPVGEIGTVYCAPAADRQEAVWLIITRPVTRCTFGVYTDNGCWSLSIKM